jgi:hypothetical protein
MNTHCTWPGKSGRAYTYQVYPLGTLFNDVAGNYAYAKLIGSRWVPCYIGQTHGLRARLASHEKEPCARRQGATHIHAKVNTSTQDRLIEEEDLIRLWNPPCNDHHTNG